MLNEVSITRPLIRESICSLDSIPIEVANDFLVRWSHKMGSYNRCNGKTWSHALFHEGVPVSIIITSTLIRENVGGIPSLNRDNCVELSRLCSCRSGLCRVALRLWREFIFPTLGYEWAISYQDAEIHNGNTYRFDGWKRAARSRSGVDTRSGRAGRDKWVWTWKLDR